VCNVQGHCRVGHYRVGHYRVSYYRVGSAAWARLARGVPGQFDCRVSRYGACRLWVTVDGGVGHRSKHGRKPRAACTRESTGGPPPPKVTRRLTYFPAVSFLSNPLERPGSSERLAPDGKAHGVRLQPVKPATTGVG
jgi:hypothetical protein